MNKQQLISYLINNSQDDGNTLANIQTPHNKREMYIKYLDRVLEEELHGSSQRQVRSTIPNIWIVMIWMNCTEKANKVGIEMYTICKPSVMTLMMKMKKVKVMMKIMIH